MIVALRQLSDLVVPGVSGVTVIIWGLRMSFVTKKQGNVNVTHNNQHSGGSATSASLVSGTSQIVSSANAMAMRTPATQQQENVSTAGTTLLEVYARCAKLDSMEVLNLVTSKCLAENVAAQKPELAVILMPKLVIWMSKLCSQYATVKMGMTVTDATSARTTSMVTPSSLAASAGLATAQTTGTQLRKEIATCTLENV